MIETIFDILGLLIEGRKPPDEEPDTKYCNICGGEVEKMRGYICQDCYGGPFH